MTLQVGGQISLSNVRTELSQSGSLNMGAGSARSLVSIASGTIKLSDFYSKTLVPTHAYFGAGYVASVLTANVYSGGATSSDPSL
jgi:hypothetical protein